MNTYPVDLLLIDTLALALDAAVVSVLEERGEQSFVEEDIVLAFDASLTRMKDALRRYREEEGTEVFGFFENA